MEKEIRFNFVEGIGKAARQTSLVLGTAVTVSGANQVALGLFDYTGDSLVDEVEWAEVTWGGRPITV